MEIYYFGAPGNGFESHPVEKVNSLSRFDKSFYSPGDIECKYIKEDNMVNIVYVLYGLGGEGDSSYRKGRNFGVGIKLEGFEIDESERKNLFEFLHRFIYQGVNQKSVGIFVPNDGSITDYQIKSFQERSSALNKISSSLINQFNTEFKNSLKKITDNKSYNLELDPEKIKLEQKKKEPLKKEEEVSALKSNKKEGNSEEINFENTTDQIIHKKPFNWWLLIFIPLFAVSISNFIELNKLKKQIQKNSMFLAKLEISDYEKTPSKKTLVKKKIVKDKIQYYVNPMDFPNSPNPLLKEIEDYINHIVNIFFQYPKIPENLNKEKVKQFIKENNPSDLPQIKTQINNLNEKQDNGVFFSDINFRNDLLIWEE